MGIDQGASGALFDLDHIIAEVFDDHSEDGINCPLELASYLSLYDKIHSQTLIPIRLGCLL